MKGEVEHKVHQEIELEHMRADLRTDLGHFNEMDEGRKLMAEADNKRVSEMNETI